eukprot:IDg5513t1
MTHASLQGVFGTDDLDSIKTGNVFPVLNRHPVRALNDSKLKILARLYKNIPQQHLDVFYPTLSVDWGDSDSEAQDGDREENPGDGGVQRGHGRGRGSGRGRGANGVQAEEVEVEENTIKDQPKLNNSQSCISFRNKRILTMYSCRTIQGFKYA